MVSLVFVICSRRICPNKRCLFFGGRGFFFVLYVIFPENIVILQRIWARMRACECVV